MATKVTFLLEDVSPPPLPVDPEKYFNMVGMSRTDSLASDSEPLAGSQNPTSPSNQDLDPPLPVMEASRPRQSVQYSLKKVSCSTM